MGLKLGRSKGRRTLDRVEGFSTCIGADTVYKGSFSGTGNCIIHGTVEGDCDLQGTLVIGDEGKWVGNVVAETILVAGTVEGDITAKDKMEIVSTARIKGKITAKVLAIAEGAIHEGQIQMTAGGKEVHFVDRRGAERREDDDAPEQPESEQKSA